MTTGQRFKLVIDDIGTTNNGLAKELEVSSTVINGIVNDTNKPGYKVLAALKKRFPQYNTDWVLEGVGQMKNTINEPNDYLIEHLRSLEKQFSEMAEMFKNQIAVKDTQLSAKDKQIEQLLGLLGKPECATETGVIKHPATGGMFLETLGQRA